jgi:hypothetical protein
MNKFITLLLVFLLSNSLWAVTGRILVSDIDDTIKISHVLDRDSALGNIPRTGNVFSGMVQVLDSIKQDYQVDEIFYLSNAPKFPVGPFHKKFLSNNKFPAGNLLLNSGLSSKTHKIESLRKIITEKNPSSIILIGDNGEKDPSIYNQIQNEFPNLKITTYIHMAYFTEGNQRKGSKIYDSQVGYGSSIDLAAHLFTAGLIKEKSYSKIVFDIGEKALNENQHSESGQLLYPAWADCRDISQVSLPQGNIEDVFLSNIQSLINDRCAGGPLAD